MLEASKAWFKVCTERSLAPEDVAGKMDVTPQASQGHHGGGSSLRQIESFLHRRFHANRMPQSEWFNLSAEQLEFARTTLLKASSDHQGHTAKTAPATLKPLAPPAPII